MIAKNAPTFICHFALRMYHESHEFVCHLQRICAASKRKKSVVRASNTKKSRVQRTQQKMIAVCYVCIQPTHIRPITCLATSKHRCAQRRLVADINCKLNFCIALLNLLPYYIFLVVKQLDARSQFAFGCVDLRNR